MTSVSATVLLAVQAAQLALKVLYALSITVYRYFPSTTVTNGTCYDFIVVGGGTAGCILANRLSANSSYSVLLIEAGNYAPLESEMAGVFTTLPSSVYDYNFTTVNDNKTSQNLQDYVIELTAGKMLGGSSALDHMIHVRTDPHDFDNWASILGDDSWNNTNLLKYMMKQENLTDAELLNSTYAALHGTDGPIKIKKLTSSLNEPILQAAKELGHNIVADTTSLTSTLGITEPLFHIDDYVRQSNAIGYLSATLSRPNLSILLDSTVIKIIFENGVAVGVKFVNSDGDEYVVCANKEVIVTAGSINSPKLLMLSGVGPSSHLQSLGIDVKADLPVGQNFQDHPSCTLVYQLETDTSSGPPANPYTFPVPTTCLYGTVTSGQTYPDYQDIILRIPPSSTAMVQLCSNSFKYSNDICDAWYAATVGRKTIFVVHNLMVPKSIGEILLASDNYTDNPLVYSGIYSNSSDLDLMAETICDFLEIVNTTTFQNLNATLVDVGVCSNATTKAEFCRCYALEMSAGMWHYIGTCAMGKVVDTDLRVKNLTNLRVADASVMPTEVSGNIKAAVNTVAEKAAALILEYWNITV